MEQAPLEEQRKDPLPITYHLGDITRMHFLDNSSFDFVITNNVIQDTEDFLDAFKEFFRVLKPGGTYIHIENHPCFATPTVGWVRDEQGKRLYRKVDHYFKRGPFLVPWRLETGMKPTVAWHRTLGGILNGLISQGFKLQRILEPEPPEFWFKLYPDRADGDSRIPDFIVLYCVKKARSV